MFCVEILPQYLNNKSRSTEGVISVLTSFLFVQSLSSSQVYQPHLYRYEYEKQHRVQINGIVIRRKLKYLFYKYNTNMFGK